MAIISDVSDDASDIMRGMSVEKALAIACYGESVAAFRYRTLAERAPTSRHEAVFKEMAEEEQGHHQALSGLLAKEFPGSEFLLTPEDKAAVIVGPRLLELAGSGAFDKAMRHIYDSERLTGSFYAAFHDTTTRADLKPLLKEMADECFEHAQRLKEIPPPSESE